MAKTKSQAAAAPPFGKKAPAETVGPRTTRSQTLIDLMRAETGASAPELGAAVGWQVHSVRGFIAGTLKKRADLSVLTERKDGATRYRVVDRAGSVL